MPREVKGQGILHNVNPNLQKAQSIPGRYRIAHTLPPQRASRCSVLETAVVLGVTKCVEP